MPLVLIRDAATPERKGSRNSDIVLCSDELGRCSFAMGARQGSESSHVSGLALI